MSFFSGHVADLLRLAEDEARMLGRVEVEPEHMLLAFCRHGHGRDLLAQRSLHPRDLHAAVVRIDGEGDDLLLGRLPRSRRSQEVLERVVTVAAERGTAWPGDVEVLLALASDERAGAVLDEAGLADMTELIAQAHPSERAPLDDGAIRRQLLAAALNEHPRPLQVRVPAFERFTNEARRAIGAAAETAARLEHREVEPFHLLLGCLQVPDSFAAQALAELWTDGELGLVGEAIELACRVGPHPSHQATGLFTDVARRVAGEDALALAYRHGHRQITTGHLLLAVLDSGDRATGRMTWPHTQRLARTLVRGLPGSEHEAGPDAELEWIVLDDLMRTLVVDSEGSCRRGGPSAARRAATSTSGCLTPNQSRTSRSGRAGSPLTRVRAASACRRSRDGCSSAFRRPSPRSSGSHGRPWSTVGRRRRTPM